ncbi:MAG: type III-A CRISPR-associated protein Csm2 [Candidatus Methanomethylicaceae archaeon]
MSDRIEQVLRDCDAFDEALRTLKTREKSEREKAKIQEKKIFRQLNQSLDAMRKEFMESLENSSLSKISALELVETARALGRYLSYHIKTNKIRRFLDALRKIQVSPSYSPGEVALIRPYLAYAVGRSDGDEGESMRKFMEFFDPIFKRISSLEDDKESRKEFDTALRFMEAVMAYHKFYGGKES